MHSPVGAINQGWPLGCLPPWLGSHRQGVPPGSSFRRSLRRGPGPPASQVPLLCRARIAACAIHGSDFAHKWFHCIRHLIQRIRNTVRAKGEGKGRETGRLTLPCSLMRMFRDVLTAARNQHRRSTAGGMWRAERTGARPSRAAPMLLALHSPAHVAYRFSY
jgi:hypothetical protein